MARVYASQIGCVQQTIPVAEIMRVACLVVQVMQRQAFDNVVVKPDCASGWKAVNWRARQVVGNDNRIWYYVPFNLRLPKHKEVMRMDSPRNFVGVGWA